MSEILANESLAPSTQATLRRLFLTLFLRGRTARGLQKDKAPKSIGRKLWLTLLVYACIGFVAASLWHQPVFALAVYLHAMTFVFLGMFVASSCGELLFNAQEADILLHRPIDPRTLLWAKVRVLIETSLWLGASFNFVGLFVGLASPDSDWRFPIVHLISMAGEALFCTGCVVLVYQLCLRWFGRERLDGLMTAAQVIVSIAAVLCGQLLPRMMFLTTGLRSFDRHSWWLALLPPSWFAGLDDALSGTGAEGSFILAALALVATAAVLWLAFAKLAQDYEAGLQKIAQVSATTAQRRSRRWVDRLVELPPLRWWLREPLSRASFLLTAAYLFRDRDTKLRIYPAMGPYLVMPIILLGGGSHASAGGEHIFAISFSGAYLCVVPMLVLGMLQYSAHWQAADILRVAPLAGPAAIFHGARRAVLCFLVIPCVVLLAVIVCWLTRRPMELLLLLPGVIQLPILALIPGLSGAVPLSHAVEEAKSVGRGSMMFGVSILSFFISGVAYLAWTMQWFGWLILIESIVAVITYAVLRRSLSRVKWEPIE